MAVMMRFVPRLPPRAQVNLNAITEDGLVRVRQTHFDRPIRAGSLVTIFEPTDEVEGLAKVVRINERTGLVYLDVAWDSLHDLEPMRLVQPTRSGMEPLSAVSGARRLAF